MNVKFFLQKFTIAVLLLAIFSCVSGARSDGTREVPDFIFGVTIDSVDRREDLLESLARLRTKVMSRIVFDPSMSAAHYREFVESVSGNAFVMGELADSYSMKTYTLEQYKNRVEEYYNQLNPFVNVWEIGNEVNGEWTGSAEEVALKLSHSFQFMQENHAASAVTFYYNEGCAQKPENSMFAWIDRHVSEEMKQNLQYVFVSFYEEDCPGVYPDFESVFQKLGEIFPRSKLGIGECGTKVPWKKEQILKKYYSMNISHERFIGGYFWWYFHQDMVPYTKPLWRTLDGLMSQF